MHIRRSPSGDGPTIYRPNESAALRLDPPPRPVAHEPDSIPPPPRDSLLMRVNRRRGQILTVMVSVAAIASFSSVVWWAHNQDVKAGEVRIRHGRSEVAVHRQGQGRRQRIVDPAHLEGVAGGGRPRSVVDDPPPAIEAPPRPGHLLRPLAEYEAAIGGGF